MKFMVKTVSIIIVLCILIIAIVAGSALVLKKTSFFEEEKTKVTSEFIGSRIQEISELATLQHHYRKIANYQDAKKLVSYLPSWRINQSIKEFMIIYEGDVKMGYDLKDIKVNVDTTTMAIEITLPDPKILSHSVDFESISIICENKGWFNEIKFEDFKKFFIEEQRKYESANHDMLKIRARKQAERVITFYLQSVIHIVKPETKAIPTEEQNPAVQKSRIKTWFHPEDQYKLSIK